MVGSTIARSPLSYFTTKVVAEMPIVGLVPRGTHDWNKYINPGELREWFTGEGTRAFGELVVQGVIYVPGLGWKVVQGSEEYGNYFFGVQKLEAKEGVEEVMEAAKTEQVDDGKEEAIRLNPD